MIFICSLLGCAVWDICRMFVFPNSSDGTEDIIKRRPVMNCIVVVYYVLMALLIYLSMINNVNVAVYCGFMRGSLSKAVYLLFCAALVFPMDGGCLNAKLCKDEGWAN